VSRLAEPARPGVRLAGAGGCRYHTRPFWAGRAVGRPGV